MSCFSELVSYFSDLGLTCKNVGKNELLWNLFIKDENFIIFNFIFVQKKKKKPKEFVKKFLLF